KDFSKVAEPLTNLTRKNIPYEWSEACQGAFELLKQYLVTTPILAFPDFSKPFILSTDASGVGLGGVLSQVDDDNKEHPIAYCSRVLSQAERKYSTTEKEML